MPLLFLPNELLLQIAEPLGPKDLVHFIKVNRFLAALLLPDLHKLALLDKDRKPALLWAARRGYEPLVRLLIDKGIDVNYTDDIDRGWAFTKGTTALHMATMNGSESIVKLLVMSGANTEARNEHGMTPFRIATSRRKIHITKLLGDLGAKVDALDKEGFTALHRECYREKDPKMVSLLLELGSDVNIKGPGGCTALHYTLAPHTRPDLSMDVILMLLARDADVNAQNEGGQTPLFPAASSYRGSFGLSQALLAAGADVNIRDNNGFTALSHSLVWGGVFGVFQLLMERGADVTLGCGATLDTALHIAAREHDESVVRCLLHGACDINLQNTAGETPLHVAAKRKSAAVIKLLLENGADSEIKDFQGNTMGDLLDWKTKRQLQQRARGSGCRKFTAS